MELYEAINKRRTVREFLDKPVDFEAIKRILEAGNKAPTWNHNRNWSFIVLRTDEEKEYAFEHAKKIADKFDAKKYLNTPRPYPTTLAQKMYAYAMPRQYTMLKDAKDGLSQKDICDKTFQAKQTVNQIISHMLDAGHVAVTEVPENKRTKIVKLTSAGVAYCEKFVRHITWAEDTAMSKFSSEEQKTLIDLSRTFTKRLTNLVNQETEEEEHGVL